MYDEKIRQKYILLMSDMTLCYVTRYYTPHLKLKKRNHNLSLTSCEGSATIYMYDHNYWSTSYQNSFISGGGEWFGMCMSINQVNMYDTLNYFSIMDGTHRTEWLWNLKFCQSFLLCPSWFTHVAYFIWQNQVYHEGQLVCLFSIHSSLILCFYIQQSLYSLPECKKNYTNECYNYAMCIRNNGDNFL